MILLVIQVPVDLAPGLTVVQVDIANDLSFSRPGSRLNSSSGRYC